MSLELIIGRSGSGKSHHIYNEMINESINDESRMYFMIVPEQFTMETQREIITRHPRHGTFQIDVVSFMRLAYRVFEECRVSVAEVLEDQGKSMVIRKLLGELSNDFKMYALTKDKPGFIDQMKSTLSELYQYEISTTQLEKLLNETGTESLLHAKLEDILLLYQAFESYLGNHYVVAEKILQLFGEVIGKSELLKNAVVYLDGFTGFTPIQYHVIEKLLAVCKKVTITITMDEAANQRQKMKPYELFWLGFSTKQKLYEIAEKNQIDIEKECVMSNDIFRYHGNKELEALEKNLFQYPMVPYEKECDCISVSQVADIREEVILAANNIKEMIKNGYRYKEIVVLSSDVSLYSHIVEEVFSQFGIPYFMDGSVSIFNNPLVEAVRSAIELAVSDFSHEKMFRYLKTEMGPLTSDEVSILENYVFAAGVRGIRKWKNDFKRKSRRFPEECLGELNEMRKKVMDSITPLTECLRKSRCTGKEAAMAVYDFIIKNHLAEKMDEYIQDFNEREEFVFAKSYEQVYDRLIELLEKLVDFLGEDEMVPEEIGDILNAGLEQIDLGVIPSVFDKVIVGDMERSRFEHIKAMIVLGANDGILPKTETASNLITDIERKQLESEGINLAPSNRIRTYISQFYVYFVLTKTSEKLLLSYHRVDGDGKAVRPSYLIERLKKIYPLLKIKEFSKSDIESLQLPLVLSEENADKFLAVKDGIEYQYQSKLLTNEMAKKIYGTTIYTSATRLENFAKCAYAHFLKYGLNLNEREEYSFESSDFGTLMHRVMELLGKEMKKEKIQNKTTWQTVTEERLQELLDISITKTLEENEELFDDSKRTAYVKNIVQKMAHRTAFTVKKQLKNSKMEPKYFEFTFPKKEDMEASTVRLSDGMSMVLRGKIDRIDTYEEITTDMKEKEKTKRNIYLKIVDYKTGNKKPSYTEIYYGVQLQLFLYLNLAKTMEENKYKKDSIPTNVISNGAFYYHVDDPIILTEETQKEKIEEEIQKQLQMQGIVNADETALNVLEDFDDKNELIGVSVKRKKDGKSLYSSDTNLNGNEMNELLDYTKTKVKQMGEELENGEISINPYVFGSSSSCDYCEYKGICGFDQKIEGYEYKKLKKVDKQSFFEKIKEEEEKDETGI